MEQGPLSDWMACSREWAVNPFSVGESPPQGKAAAPYTYEDMLLKEQLNATTSEGVSELPLLSDRGDFRRQLGTSATGHFPYAGAEANGRAAFDDRPYVLGPA